MINSLIVLGESNDGGDPFIREVRTLGHSGKKFSHVCSAVSILEYTFFYSVKAMSGVSFREESLQKGDFGILVDRVDEKDKLAYNYLCGFFLIGMKTLAKEYESELNLNIVEE